MGSTGSFEETDRQGALNFAYAAAKAGVRRIIYLGGLGDSQQPLSAHLRSRHEVGEILRSTGVQVIEFRASIVIGSGSLSFEMVRALVERLPVMIAPRWVSVLSQPIAVFDLLSYLVAALDAEISDSRVFEIGGADRVSYGDLMREYARQRGLRRLIIPVPVLTPRLSSLWLGLVTPLYARVGRKLVDSICHPTVIRDHSVSDVFPIAAVGFREAIRFALRNEDLEYAESRWSDAMSSSGAPSGPSGDAFGSRFVDSRAVDIDCAPEQVFATIERIGGQTGWYFTNWLWGLRGLMDLAIGGIGMRRGRPHPERLRVGDTLDCWRVEAVEPGQRLRLAAEMKLPGRAWLEFEVTDKDQFSQLRQTATFDARGVLGRAYWYLVYPLHQVVFAGMLRGIAAASSQRGAESRKAFDPSVPVQVLMFLLFLAACFGTAAARAVLRRGAPPSEQSDRATGGASLLPRVERLPGTAMEAKAITPQVAAYSGGEAPIVYTDRYALEAVFKAVTRPKVLVMNTHRFILPDQLVHEMELIRTPGQGAGLARDGRPLENPLLRCGLFIGRLQ